MLVALLKEAGTENWENSHFFALGISWHKDLAVLHISFYT